MAWSTSFTFRSDRIGEQQAQDQLHLILFNDLYEHIDFGPSRLFADLAMILLGIVRVRTYEHGRQECKLI